MVVEGGVCWLVETADVDPGVVLPVLDTVCEDETGV